MASLREAQTLYRSGNLLGAQAACIAVIEKDPHNIDALYLLAVTGIDSGAYDFSDNILTTLMRTRPDRADIHGTAGVVALRQGDPLRAAGFLVRACRLTTVLGPHLQNLVPCLAAVGLGRRAARMADLLFALVPGQGLVFELIARFGRYQGSDLTRLMCGAVTAKPNSIPGLQGLLNAAEIKASDKMRVRHRLVALWPEMPDILNNAGQAALNAGALREAARLTALSVAKKADAPTLGNVALLMAQSSTYHGGRAIDLAALSIAMAPGSPSAWEAMASVQELVSAPGGSIPFWRTCRRLSANPSYHVRLAASLRMADRLEEAEATALEALAGSASTRETHYKAAAALAAIQRGRGKADAATATIKTIPAQHQDPGIAVRDALTLPIVLETADAIPYWRERLVERLDRLEEAGVRIDDPFREVGQTAFHAAYHGLDDRRFQERIARFFRQSCPALTYSAPHLETAGPETERIRIGFISRFLKDHTIGKLMAGLIAGLDRQRFEIVLLPFAAQSDGLTAELAAQADRHVPLPTDLFAARGKIAAQRLDILFYCDIGMDPLTYFLAYARLARWQCVTWGHPVTTGLETIDAFFSAGSIERPDAGADYTEKLIRLPRLPAVYGRPNPAADMIGIADPASGLGRVYSCPQSTFKFHPDFDAVWAGILDRDRAARLVIVAGKDPEWDAILTRRFAKTHPNVASRLVILPRLRRGAFFKLLDRSAATLDPLHFGSGNTAYETFAVGTPMVTLPGRFMRGRVTDGCYRQMGVDDLRASSTDDYIERTVRLGQDADWRAHCKSRILTSNQELYEDRAAIRAVEQALIDLMSGG